MKKYLFLLIFAMSSFFLKGAININQSAEGITSGTSIYYDNEEFVEYTISITNTSTDSAITLTSIDMDFGTSNFDLTSAQLSYDKNLWSEEGDYKIDENTGRFSATGVKLSENGYIDYHVIIKTSVNADGDIVTKASYTDGTLTTNSKSETIIKKFHM